MKKQSLFIISLVTSIMSPGAAVQAQSGALEEIIVTAQRREQSVQEVPISLQVLGADELARNQIRDMDALRNISASITFDTGIAAKSHSFGIRGVSTSASNTKAFQSSVAIILDGVAMARNSEFVRDLGDVERVEVLRGPQGTLFGKNATAGVINITTKGPTAEPDGFMETSITDDAEYLLQGAIGGPVANGVRGRVFATWRDQNPTIENISKSPTANDVNGREMAEISGKLEIDVADDGMLALAADYNDMFGESAGQQVLIEAPGQFNKEFPVLPGDKYRINRDGANEYKQSNYGGSGILTWNLNDAWTFINTTGYRKTDSRWWFDQDAGKCGLDGIGAVCFNQQGNASTGGGGINFNTGQSPRMNSDMWHISNETQFQFSSDDMTFISGLYYEHLEDNLIQQGPTLFLDTNDADLLPNSIQDQTRGPSHVENDTYSIFGDTTYGLTDTISVFGGLRYTHEKISGHLRNTRHNFNLLTGSPAANSGPPILPAVNYMTGPLTSTLTYILMNGDTIVVPNVVNQPLTLDTGNRAMFPLVVDLDLHETFNNLSGRVGFSWQPTDQQHYFISAARGYKGPSADLDFGAAVAPFATEELATSFEAGFKGTFGDGHTLGLAVFTTKIEDLQQNTSVPGAVPPQTLLQNIGDLRSSGADMDFVFRVTDNFDLSGTVAYVHARMLSGNFACYGGQTAAEGCDVVLTPGSDPVQDLSGLQPVNAPDWRYRIAGYYSLLLADMPWDGYANASWTWQDEQVYEMTGDPMQIGKPYGLLDFTVGVEAKSGSYNVEIFGKNALDNWYPGTIGSTAPLYAEQLFIATRGQHAYFGMRVRVNLL